MIAHNNIDITDARYNTNAPFKHGCALDTGYGALPAFLILAVRLASTEKKCEARVSRIALTETVNGAGSELEMRFSNSYTDQFMGIARIGFGQALPTSTYEMYPITDGAGLYRGHIALVNGGSAFLKSLCMRGPIVPGKDDFILLDECIYAQHSASVYIITINGSPVLPGDTIRLEAPIVYEDEALSYLGDYKGELAEGQKNGITKLEFYVESEAPDPSTPGETIVVQTPMEQLGGGVAKIAEVMDAIREKREWMGTRDEDTLDAYATHLLMDSFQASNVRISMGGDTVVIKGVRE